MSTHIQSSKTYLDIATGTETGLNILHLESFDGGTDPSHFGFTFGDHAVLDVPRKTRAASTFGGSGSIVIGATGNGWKGGAYQQGFDDLSTDTGYAGHATWVIVFRFKWDNATLGSDGWQTIYLDEMGNSANQQIVFEFRSDGKIRARKGNAAKDNNGLLLEESTLTVAANTWYRCEARVTVGVAGAWHLQIDGTQYLNGTGDTYTAYGGASSPLCGFVKIGSNSSVNPPRNILDDVLFADGGGASTTYPDDLRIYARHPTSNSEVQGTPSTGTNWECVDEVGQDDTDFVDFGGGAKSLKAVAKLSGVTAEGSLRTFTSIPTSVFGEPQVSHVYVTKPGGGAWASAANVNDSTFGIRTAGKTDLYNFQDLGVAGTPIAVQVTNRVGWTEIADDEGVWGTVRM